MRPPRASLECADMSALFLQPDVVLVYRPSKSGDMSPRSKINANQLQIAVAFFASIRVIRG